MAPRPERPSARPARSRARVQPGAEGEVGDDDAEHPAAGLDVDGPARPEELEGTESPAWLDDAGADREADRVDRLAADYNLVTSLAWNNFSGPAYHTFASALAEYGVAVISGWIRRKIILVRVRDRGLGGLETPPDGAFDDPDVAAELAYETVTAALVYFRKDALMGHRWDYRRGASLRTYFVGACLITFSNVYRSWLAHEGDRRPQDLADPDTLDELAGRSAARAVAGLAVDRATIDRELADARNDRIREALMRHARDTGEPGLIRLLGHEPTYRTAEHGAAGDDR